jgi:hypothetical protein
MSERAQFEKWADSAVVVFFFAGLLLFLFFTGALNSGYHFIDDHEMIRIYSDLKSNSFFHVASQWITNDFNIRFRPIYYLHRVLELRVFGDNFFALSFYTGLLAASTFSFFYLGARRLKYNILESLLFVFLTFIGSQMVVWWKLGPNETIGMLFLGLSFFFMAKSASGKKYLLNSALFSFFLILASLSKENFVAIIPAFVLYKIWNERRIFNISVKKSIRKNRLSLILLVVMTVELWIIIFAIGTKNLGYAGSTSSARELLLGVYNILANGEMLLRWIKLMLILLSLFIGYLVLSKYRRKVSLKQSIQNILPSLTFFLLVFLTNIIFYAKSGMAERYLLPTTLGVAFFAVDMIRNTKNRFFQKGMILACVIFAFFSYNIAKKSAFAFAAEGKQTNELLTAIVKNAKQDSDNLLVADPIGRFEATDSLKTFVASQGVGNIYGYPIAIEYKLDFGAALTEKWMEWFKGKTMEYMKSQPGEIIFLDKWQDEKFFEDSGFQKKDYQNILTAENPHALYLRK